MSVPIVRLPQNVRRHLGQLELRKIEIQFVNQRAEEENRKSTAATLTMIRDLQDPEQRPFTIKDIEGLRSITAEEGGRVKEKFK